MSACMRRRRHEPRALEQLLPHLKVVTLCTSVRLVRPKLSLDVPTRRSAFNPSEPPLERFSQEH
eukprot:m.185328 g.185328  ORF g.185328 m.185328 type:complete len:64 (+) comp18491_c1_seq27:4097-4288(+)